MLSLLAAGSDCHSFPRVCHRFEGVTAGVRILEGAKKAELREKLEGDLKRLKEVLKYSKYGKHTY